MAFQIPFARLIEDIIAGLPTNSRQAIQLRELAAKIEVLQREKEELKAKLAELEPKHGMDIETVKILKVFFDEARDLSAEEVAGIADIQKSKVSYHIDELRKLKFVMPSRAITSHSPATYAIYPDGRAFVIKHKLA
jgi:Fic family protein